jgi:hypothetical protein
VAPELGLDRVVCGHLARLWIHGIFPLLIVNRGLHAGGSLVAGRGENRRGLIFIRNFTNAIMHCAAYPPVSRRSGPPH